MWSMLAAANHGRYNEGLPADAVANAPAPLKVMRNEGQEG